MTFMSKYILFGLLTVLALVSCGTGKKLESANAQISSLNSEISSLTARLAENEKIISADNYRIAVLEKENEVNSRDAEQCRAAKELEKQRLAKLESELAARGTSLQEIDAKMKKNVQDFKDVGCDVKYVKGSFFITVPDDFTFKSGSVGVGPQSRRALNVVAQIMRDDPGVVATIIGNTDTIPFKGGADNWSLSTERANNVIRLLEDTYAINPSRLTSAGRSKYYPIASNETEEGRQKNRRVEIIINPRLERLEELIKSN